MKNKIELMYKKSLRRMKYYNVSNNLKEIQSKLLTKSGFVRFGSLSEDTYVHLLYPKLIIKSHDMIINSDSIKYTNTVFSQNNNWQTLSLEINSEEDFFQYSTIENVFDLTYDDILSFKEREAEIVQLGRNHINDMMLKVNSSTIFPKQTENRVQCILEHFNKL